MSSQSYFERKLEKERSAAAERKLEKERIAAERKLEQERSAAKRKQEQERSAAAEMKRKKERLAVQRKWEEKKEKYDWVTMETQYESLEKRIMKYVERKRTLDIAVLYLKWIFDDIQRKFVNEQTLATLSTLSWKVLMEYIWKPIQEKQERLPERLEFFRNEDEGPEYYGRDCINLAFQNRSKTLYLIQAEMVILLQKAKEILEVNYVDGSMYSPHAEIPSRDKHKQTEGDNWTGFCETIDELSLGEHDRDSELKQLLHDFKMLGK